MSERMPPPLVSIGFPVYNGEKTVRQTLDSILAQDFEDFELIISDNASTDNTAAICQDYAARDRRIRYFRNPSNIGVGPNHNRVFEISRGRYFAWAAHDLEYLPSMMRRCLTTMQEAPRSMVVAYPRCELVDDDGKPVLSEHLSIARYDPKPHRRLKTTIRRICYVTQLYGLIAAEALRKTRLFGSFPSSDFVLVAELAMLGEIREIPEVLLRRQMGKNSGTNAVRHSKKAWAAWIDPKTKVRYLQLPLGVRLAFEYIRSARHLPLSPRDKLACIWAGPAAQFGRTVSDKIDRWRRRGRPARNLSRPSGAAGLNREAAATGFSSATRSHGPAAPIENAGKNHLANQASANISGAGQSLERAPPPENKAKATVPR
jgi:glycosyltransferase involved in cell wall biosynthesis